MNYKAICPKCGREVTIKELTYGKSMSEMAKEICKCGRGGVKINSSSDARGSEKAASPVKS